MINTSGILGTTAHTIENMSEWTYSVVVPVYNSEQSLPLLLERLIAVFSKIGANYEIILVNDGSSDNSWHIICELSSRYPELIGINLMRNFGQHNALLFGIRRAKNRIIVTLDDDLQNPPEEIPKLLTHLAEGYDVIYGTPNGVQKQGLLRNLASQITRLVLSASMNAKVAHSISPFRVFRAQLSTAFDKYESPFVSIDVLLTWGTTRFGSLEVRHDARAFGTSKYTLRKLLTHTLNLITGFSVWPLQISSIIGLFFTVLGGLIFVFVVVQYLGHGTSVPGFTFLASIVAIFSGVQLFSLGILGEYLLRMHIRMMGRPSAIAREFVTSGLTVLPPHSATRDTPLLGDS